MSYFFAAGRAEIAGRDVHHPVRQAEAADDASSIARIRSCSA